MPKLLPISAEARRFRPEDLFGPRIPPFPPSSLVPRLRALELGQTPIPKIKVSGKALIAEKENILNWLTCVFSEISTVEVEELPLSPEERLANEGALDQFKLDFPPSRDFYDDNQLELMKKKKKEVGEDFAPDEED